MSSGAGIDAATFEQLKATLYKANGGGARTVAKTTKKRSVRRGGVFPEDGDETTPIEYSEDDVCPMITPGPFTEFLKTKNIDLDTVSQDDILSLYEEFLKTIPVDMVGGKKTHMQRGGGWPTRQEVQQYLKDVAINSGRCLAGFLSTESYRNKIIAAEGAAAKAAALVGYATPATAAKIKTAAETDAATWLGEVSTNAAADPTTIKEYLTSDTFNSELTRHIAVMDLKQLKILVEYLSKLIGKIQEETVEGGARRRTTKRKGGALDMSKLYNVQGLIGTSKDPLQLAAAVATDNTPLPFSAGSSAGISYTSGINQEFINQLTPALGQAGGRIQRAADGGRIQRAADGGRKRIAADGGRRRKAKRGGAPPLSQEEATNLITNFLTAYDTYSDGANFASQLRATHWNLLNAIYIIVMNAFFHLRNQHPLKTRVTVAKLVQRIETNKLIPEMPTDASTIYTQISSLNPTDITFATYNIESQLYNKDDTIDIGLLQVLLQKQIEYLGNTVTFPQIDKYHNMIIRNAYTNRRKMECGDICNTIYNECQKYKALAEKLLAHINNLIEGGFYKSSYNVDEMRREIQYARAENASQLIHQTRVQSARRTASEFMLASSPHAAGGRGKRAAQRGGVEIQAMDRLKMYNVQGLIGNSTSKDPVVQGAAIGTDETPLPFSTGSSAGIAYTSGINLDFINQLTPALGQAGGRIQRAADGGAGGRKRAAKRA